MKIYFDKEEARNYFRLKIPTFGEDPSIFDCVFVVLSFIFSVIYSPIILPLVCIKIKKGVTNNE